MIGPCQFSGQDRPRWFPIPHGASFLFSLSLYFFLLPPSFVTTDTFSCPLIKTESPDATLKSSSSSFYNQQQSSVNSPVALVSRQGQFSQAVYLTTFVCEVIAVHPILSKQVYTVKQTLFFTVKNCQPICQAFTVKIQCFRPYWRHNLLEAFNS